jgi:hypothetical protein
MGFTGFLDVLEAEVDSRLTYWPTSVQLASSHSENLLNPAIGNLIPQILLRDQFRFATHNTFRGRLVVNTNKEGDPLPPRTEGQSSQILVWAALWLLLRLHRNKGE